MDKIPNKTANIKMMKAKSKDALDMIENMYRKEEAVTEIIPWADGTRYSEIAENIVPDKGGSWVNPLVFTRSLHRSSHGIRNLCNKASDFLEKMKVTIPMDVLSISGCMDGESGRISLKILVRPYQEGYQEAFFSFFDYVGETVYEDWSEDGDATSGTLIIPDEIKNFSYTEEEQKAHDKKYAEQKKALERADEEHPFLNSINEYVPKKLPMPEDHLDLVYDLITNDMKYQTISSYEHFTEIFREVMKYVSGVDRYHYITVMKGEDGIDQKTTETSYMQFLEQYVRDEFVKTGRFDREDVPVLMKKLYRSLFQLYIVQDLIDDPNVTDIKITAPDAIRARVKGKAYMSNIHFVDRNDYLRFIEGIAIRNGIQLNVPSQTFTDTSDENYILRFSITAEYVNSVDWPYLHIRKIARKKLLGDDLLKAGMFDEKIRDYLLDCGRNSRGVVFAGPPGSGKTVCLNWFLEEAYEQSAEILVIQENDELFCYRKGVMFQHVVNYSNNGERPVNLEQLGQLALVAGANVFVIGEAKGAEICSAITLSNSGCRTAITIHSPSSTETLDKMADLAMRGYAQNYDQALRMLKSFQTIVYLENFAVKEISEIVGYDEEAKTMKYKVIYRKPENIKQEKEADKT